MTDRTPPDHADAADTADLSPDLIAALADEQTWVDAPAGLEDWVVSAISAELTDPLEADPGGADPVGARPAAAVTELDARRRWRSIGLAAAAVAVVVAGVFAVFAVDRSGDGADVELALTATELAPGASADAAIDDTPLGTRILLDLRDLPPAAPGTYYEAWLRIDAEIGVSAGTFHMRGGDGQIELWAGVTIDDYPLMTITVQDEGGGAASSGRVVLRGRFEP